MEVIRLIIVFSLTPALTLGFIITNLIDYTDFKEDCIVHYLSRYHPNHNLDITAFVSVDEDNKSDDFCDNEIERFERAFYSTIEDNLMRNHGNESQDILECTINQLRAYNVSEMFLKAIAYNYYPTKFVTFNKAMESCKGIIKYSNNDITDVCDERVLAVILTDGNKSLNELQSCLNDLFRELELNKIVLNDEFNNSPYSIQVRSFGMHTITYIQLLANMAINLCSTIENIDKMFDSAQLNSIENLFNIKSEIFVEKFHAIAIIDLFGFSRPSKNVEQCIIDEHRRKYLSQLCSRSNEVSANIDEEKLQQQNLKDFTNIVLSCLKFF
ncbi:unnamed protein product [Chironomus riparius]|uniref:Uncharacterized protein n=1 Tax=Chironomus riparius TaxID=315576 RepID=A0A9N9RSZ7_9DIPT|nr:unnamed protein product [Chironomus riparius]